MKSNVDQLVSAMFAVCALGASSYALAFDSGSTGADGAFNPIVNTEVQLPPTGILNYTTINIPSGVTVTFKKNAANTPVYLLASGNVTISGLIDIRGENSPFVGTAADGNLLDDGLPGKGGPGGFAGGRGGQDGRNTTRGPGGNGLGPGGGAGGDAPPGTSCTASSLLHELGTAGAYANDIRPYSAANCGSIVTAMSSAYGSALLQPLIGGSGGGGGYGGTELTGSGGGGGGGAMLIASSITITFNGEIYADGGQAGTCVGTGCGGPGAGGSGGAVRLVATTLTGSGHIYARGVTSGYYYYSSDGRIRLEADYLTFAGSTSPVRTFSTPNPLFITNGPTLQIASVAGQVLTATPTGKGDVSLPESTTGPVDVVFATANVPVGTIVKLRIVPVYSAVIDVSPVAITGSSAAGTATVSVTLPQGTSTLQATAVYTVTLAAAESQNLVQYAQNEVVEKVQLTVASQGGTLAKLITASGKAYDISYEALRASGFRG